MPYDWHKLFRSSRRLNEVRDARSTSDQEDDRAMRAESVGGSMLVSDAAPSVTHILADQAARGDLEAFDQLVAMH